MQAIIFNKKVWKDLESLRDYAKQNVIGMQEMELVAAGAADPSSADPKYQRFIPGGYRVVFSIHDLADGARMRLFTLQHVTEFPATEIINFLTPFFGFKALVSSPFLHVMHSETAIIVMEIYTK
jgi:hypothetical protein